MKRDKEKAAKAAQLANTGVFDLLNIVRFGDGERGSHDAAEAEAHLLGAVRLAMELSGFHPEETARGALYRMICDYILTLGDEE